MATYKVNSDGKAPSGLKKGDTVVTAGGTYKVTGTKAGGGYTSEKVSNTTTGTYKGSYSNKSSSGSKGSSGSKTNTGTTINGVTYGTGNGGYQADINKAAASGNYKLAAQLEQIRNKLIDSGGSSYSKTNDYSGWLDSTDYGTLGRQQMAAGASAEDVYKTYLDRYNKASGTVGLGQYANDEIQQEMWDYIQANLNKPNFNIEDFLGSRPEYGNGYSSRIDDMLNQILNRDKFSYNAATDPLYQQYAALFNREGNRAMNDTLAAAAANAGGMNSYAMTAAQQANDYYSAQLNDKIPELYQLAYSMYMDDIDGQVRDLGLLQDMDSTQYSRYRDTMNDWRNDLDFAYNQYRDSMGDWQWSKNFDYNAGRDQVSDRRYESEQAYNRAMDFLNAGLMPDSSVLEAAGLSENEAASILAQQTAGGRGSSSGSSGSYSGGTGSGTGGDDVYTGMYKAGVRNEGDAYAWLLSAGYNTTQAGKLAGYYTEWMNSQGSVGSDMGNLSQTAQSIKTSIESGKLSASAALRLIQTAEEEGMSQEVADYLMSLVQ